MKLEKILGGVDIVEQTAFRAHHDLLLTQRAEPAMVFHHHAPVPDQPRVAAGRIQCLRQHQRAQSFPPRARRLHAPRISGIPPPSHGPTSVPVLENHMPGGDGAMPAGRRDDTSPPEKRSGHIRRSTVGARFSIRATRALLREAGYPICGANRADETSPRFPIHTIIYVMWESARYGLVRPQYPT